MRLFSNILLIIIINLSCLSIDSEQTYLKMSKIKFVSEYQRLKENSILIDVRTFDEFKKGSILDAINIDFYNENFLSEISKLDRKKTIFVFCHSGGRSKKSKKLFFKSGFKKVIDLRGGIN